MAEGVTLIAQLVIAADGRNSPLRQAAGITARQTTHDQTALVTTFQHSRPHHGVSTEMHRDAGPLTTVPMPDLGGRKRIETAISQLSGQFLLHINLAKTFEGFDDPSYL